MAKSQQFDSSAHPRGRAGNKGQFRNKPKAAASSAAGADLRSQASAGTTLDTVMDRAPEVISQVRQVTSHIPDSVKEAGQRRATQFTAEHPRTQAVAAGVVGVSGYVAGKPYSGDSKKVDFAVRAADRAIHHAAKHPHLITAVASIFGSPEVAPALNRATQALASQRRRAAAHQIHDARAYQHAA